jgi:Tol biopolymer transport system component
VVSVVVRHAPPADGSRIVFASDREGNFELYSSDPDGSDLLRLTSTSANELYPAFSPDRSKVVFASDENGSWNLFLADADGANRQQLTSYDLGDGFGAVHPAFSPDGQQIAFAFFGGFGSDGVHIQAMAVAPDAVPVALTAGSRVNAHPRYAPDGRIVFASRAEDDLWAAVWIMYGNGASPTQLTGGTLGGEGTPSVSPDGSTIIFARGGLDDSEIWRMDMDGGNQRAVTANDSNDAQPSFSPDGAWIAFTSSRGAATDVLVMRLDRPEAEAWNITESAERDVMGDWR